MKKRPQKKKKIIFSWKNPSQNKEELPNTWKPSTKNILWMSLTNATAWTSVQQELCQPCHSCWSIATLWCHFNLGRQRDNDGKFNLCMQDLLSIVQSKKRQSLADPSQIVPDLMLVSALFVVSEKHATEAAKLIRLLMKFPKSSQFPPLRRQENISIAIEFVTVFWKKRISTLCILRTGWMIRYIWTQYIFYLY